jgi:group I intron endonuclease
MKGIYCIENIVNSKKYYGSSMNIEKRLKSHLGGLRKGHHINVFLQRSYNKYGEDNFSFYLVEDMGSPSRAELHLREQQYIDDNQSGYNIAPANGGDTLSKHPDKDSIIIRRKEKHIEWLKTLSPEDRKLRWGKTGSENPNWRNGGISKKTCPQCGIKVIASCAETCSSCRPRSGQDNPFFGKRHTEEYKQTSSKKAKENSWIRGIDPSELPYTKRYEITYPAGTTKIVHGLNVIAEEFGVSIANVHATIKRMTEGKLPSKSVFKGHLIKEVK